MTIYEQLCRRRFLEGAGVSLGAAALRALLADDRDGKKPGFAPRAKSVIYLHMEGAPPTLDMFDRKPTLDRYSGDKCPDEFLKKERFAFIKGHPKLLGHKHGWIRAANGVEMCELFPHLAQQMGDVTLIRSMYTDQFNHAPAEHLLFSGAPRPGRPSMGAWLSYGLGSQNRDLPDFVVMVSGGMPSAGKALWSAGFLPSVHQGVEFRSKGDPVLYVQNPAGVSRAQQRDAVDAIAALNRLHDQNARDPEIATRIAQFEMAFRMQASVPELADLGTEPQEVLDLYGVQGQDGSFASNCLLARRLAERGVRFVQVYHRAWDHHGGVKRAIDITADEVDKATAALITDLKRRGMLDDTLVLWGGEFGRTPMGQGSGRDHHIRGFSYFLAGGGVKGGVSHGATDELGYHAVEDVVHVRDLHATILHLLGIDHDRLSVPFQGLDVRLTGVEPARPIRAILA